MYFNKLMRVLDRFRDLERKGGGKKFDSLRQLISIFDVFIIFHIFFYVKDHLRRVVHISVCGQMHGVVYWKQGNSFLMSVSK